MYVGEAIKIQRKEEKNMSKEERNELDQVIKKLNLSKGDVAMEAEAVEEYGEWIHMDLMGYSSEELYDAAGRMTA